MTLTSKLGRGVARFAAVALATPVLFGISPMPARPVHEAAPERPAGACRANLADRLRSTANAAQLVLVEAPTTSSTTATVTLWDRRAGCFAEVGGPWPARLGWHGLSSHHLEGDGTTPIGAFGVGPVMYGVAPDPGVVYRYHQLTCGDWWDEDPTTPAYNRFVHVPCGQRPPFGGDSEALWTEIPAYDYFAVIEYNTAPIVPGRGSAIFLHVSTTSATDGCVSLDEPELVRTLRWLRPARHPLVIIGPAASVRDL